MTVGRSIRLFLVDGSPTGILTAEIVNWTGGVVVAPRSRIADLVKRKETARTGVYFLTGPDPDDPLRSVVYIGESENVAKRIVQHNKDENKDYWDRVCVVTSKDQNLTKGHVRYLESRLISIATVVGRSNLMNGTEPEVSPLPEADVSDMEYFIEQLRIVLPVLGMEFLRDKPALPKFTKRTEENVDEFSEWEPFMAQTSPEFIFSDRKATIEAEAVELNGLFFVVAGSTARAQMKSSLSIRLRQMRDQLIKEGKLVETDTPGVLRFRDSVEFSSPSAAAAFIMGTSRNGRDDWKVKETGQSYKEWQEAEVDAVPIDDE
ncbi:GIY-YIG nuclease family protein [Terasakiella pusilla]|uniref:GIY-YIG nuclease family protein n=1 Tax=Terasakiella pusilla TaxID=64973 RepID=UPI003AA92572